MSSTGGMRHTRQASVYHITGMDCPMEEALIRKKLEGMAGVGKLEFNLVRRVLTVEHTLASDRAIVDALVSIGMPPEAVGAREASGPERGADVPWRRLALGGLCAALAEALDLIPAGTALPAGGLIPWLCLLFALAAIGLTGLSTYRKGWIAVRHGNLNMNALMSVAVTGAVFIGQYPEAAMVMVLFNISEAIEARALDRARKAIRDLMALAPERAALLLPDGSWQETDIGQVSVGGRVRVKPGEKFALDGIVVRGKSSVNQAPITGESMPVEKGPGDSVYAGTINESGELEYEVTAPATGSTLARIIHAVEEAQATRAPVQRLVDSFARWYTPAVFLAALLFAFLPPLLGGAQWGASVYTALTLLVIGCPCALVISTPVTLVCGMAAGTRAGILIKGGAFLEQGRQLRWLALDKTGTLTSGVPVQTDFVVTGDLGAERSAVLAASLAARSDHPVSRALAAHAARKGVAPLEVAEFTAMAGRGVSGKMDGQTWFLGNYGLLESLGKADPGIAAQIRELEAQGKTVVALAGDGVQALFAVADTLRESSAEAVRAMKKYGVRTMMLTGDNEHTARAIAARVGVDECRWGLLPEDKLRIVEELMSTGAKVGMVGDGINDAPALAKATIGFSMAGNGTDTAIETADVALMDDDLRKIPRFLALSRSTHAIVVQNIVFALGVKALFFSLALLGMASMWMAVFADVGTALIVVANGLRAGQA